MQKSNHPENVLCEPCVRRPLLLKQLYQEREQGGGGGQELHLRHGRLGRPGQGQQPGVRVNSQVYVKYKLPAFVM